MVKVYVYRCDTILDIVYQNPKVKVRVLLGSEAFTYAQNAVQEAATEEQFAEFEL